MVSALERPADPVVTKRRAHVAAVVPAYRVRQQILGVIERIGPEVSSIYVVDDACPERSGELVAQECRDERVRVVMREQNGGVGAAVKSGYRAALEDGADIVVKIDGDGQMDPSLVLRFVGPIDEGLADYVKGNRFFDPEDVKRMPAARLFGNAVLSFMTKLSTGYWQLFDPTNGYTAIHRVVLGQLPLDKIANDYFFETDMLFRLGTFRAVVVDVPMEAVYGDETSSLHIRRVLGRFLIGHIRATFKRIMYSYFLRGFSVASVELVLGTLLLVFGILTGALTWANSIQAGTAATSGQVMLAALPILVGLQLVLSFLQFDIAAVPSVPLSRIVLGGDRYGRLRPRSSEGSGPGPAGRADR